MSMTLLLAHVFPSTMHGGSAATSIAVSGLLWSASRQIKFDGTLREGNYTVIASRTHRVSCSKPSFGTMIPAHVEMGGYFDGLVH